MLTVLLALGSALMYGLSDFLGGYLSRRTSVWAVAIVTQGAAVVAIGLTTALVGGDPTNADWTWGAVAGVGAGIGTAFLYRGLAGGRMGVVAPLSAVGSALLPVSVGVITGERPPLIVWSGIALAFPAIWLIARSSESTDAAGAAGRLNAGVIDGLLAGLGFGLMFSALGQVPDSAGFAPLAASEAVSIPVIIGLALVMRQPWIPHDRASLGGVVVGALAAAAAVLFLLASQAGLLTVASVLSSLYPAFTVLLAAVLLRERVHRSQGIGLALAVGAVAMVAAG
ncbi:MAG: EamA family transporter [Candidatus Limnocylindria bacterium]